MVTLYRISIKLAALDIVLASSAMAEKLEQILRIRPLQERVIILRNNSTELYRRIIKKAHTAELSKVIRTDVVVDDVVLNIPEPSSLPPILDVETNFSKELDDLIEDYTIVSNAIDLL